MGHKTKPVPEDKGEPASPALESPEELARWLVENDTGTTGDNVIPYKQWLQVCKNAYTLSIEGRGRENERDQ